MSGPQVLGVFFSASLIFFSRPGLSESYYVLVANPLILGISVSIALTLATNLQILQHTQFLLTTLSTALLSLLKWGWRVLSLSTSKLSTVVLKLAKSVYDANIDVSMPDPPFKSAIVAQLDRLNSIFVWFRKIFVCYIFHMNPAVEWITITIPFKLQFSGFSLDYFFNLIFMAFLLQLFHKIFLQFLHHWGHY